jgi:hypothetical protein
MGSTRTLPALCVLALAACTDEASRTAVVQEDVLAAFSAATQVGVIVSFEDPLASWSVGDLEKHRSAIASSREALSPSSPCLDWASA